PAPIPDPDPSNIPPSPEPAAEDADPMSVPLPAPPRLPTQVKTRQPRQLPPLPDLPDLSDASPSFRQTEKLPDVPSLQNEPSFPAARGFPIVPPQFQVAIPRVAERPPRDRQPVQLQTPELELNAEPINPNSVNNDPFDDEPRSQGGNSSSGPVPDPNDDENLELSPVPPPPTLDPADSEIEPQSSNQGADQDLGRSRLKHADVESGELPPHSAQRGPRNRGVLRVVNLRLARNSRVGPESAIDSETLHAGQKILVQGDLAGLNTAQSDGQYQTRICYHVELLATRENVVHKTERQFTGEFVRSRSGVTQVSQWLTVPPQLPPGTYRLRLRVQDEISQDAAVTTDLRIRVL
ncbi:MAG: hypothetical protein JWM11_453, partial [Planctomycetaceae bacterium]|nr:hypothetical protein [Planctomycetaceae bacterium]